MISVREDRGGLVIRLQRFTIQSRTERNGAFRILEGQTVGVRVAPTNVRVLRTEADP